MRWLLLTLDMINVYAYFIYISGRKKRVVSLSVITCLRTLNIYFVSEVKKNDAFRWKIFFCHNPTHKLHLFTSVQLPPKRSSLTARWLEWYNRQKVRVIHQIFGISILIIRAEDSRDSPAAAVIISSDTKQRRGATV